MKKGITLTSLVITVILLIILAGVGIGTLGPDGIIAKAEEAKKQAQIDDEKEIIGTSVVQAVGVNRYGNIEKEELEIYLEKNAGDRPTQVIDNGETIIVEFEDTNRYYEIDADGDVREVEIIIDENPGDITVGINGEELDGTEDKPFEIWCIEDLVEFSENYGSYRNSYIVLGRTLDFNLKLSYSNGNKLGCSSVEELMELLTNTSGVGFTPVTIFSGTFDGQNYAIKNIYINKTGFAGLIAENYGTIQNLIVSGKITSTDTDAGSIAGKCAGGNIINCINQTAIVSNGETGRAGGIVGVLTSGGTIGGRVEGCYNYGTVSGNQAGRYYTVWREVLADPMHPL